MSLANMQIFHTLPNRWPSRPSTHKTFLSLCRLYSAWKDWFERLQINDSFLCGEFWLSILSDMAIINCMTFIIYSGIKLKHRLSSLDKPNLIILTFIIHFPVSIYLTVIPSLHIWQHQETSTMWISHLITQLMDVRSYRCWLWLPALTDLWRLVNTDREMAGSELERDQAVIQTQTLLTVDWFEMWLTSRQETCWDRF